MSESSPVAASGGTADYGIVFDSLATQQRLTGEAVAQELQHRGRGDALLQGGEEGVVPGDFALNGDAGFDPGLDLGCDDTAEGEDEVVSLAVGGVVAVFGNPEESPQLAMRRLLRSCAGSRSVAHDFERVKMNESSLLGEDEFVFMIDEES